MKSLKTKLAITALSLLCLCGCYNRDTDNYENVPVMETANNAAVAEADDNKAQEAAQAQELKKIAAEPEPPYTINSGDTIAVTVYNHPDMGVNTVVTPDGYIGMVFIGQTKIAGLSLGEASEKLESMLAKYIKNPKVGLSLIKIASQTASISGGVSRPGIYDIANGMRLTDLFAKAGGSSARYYDGQTLDAADFKNSIFVRNGKVLPVDFFKAIERGDPIHNVLLRKGDYIYVAVRSESMVCLIGEVNNPHKRLWDKNLGLLELLATGGYVKETYWPYAIIIRGGVSNPKMYKIDIDAILQGRASNVKLEPGDVVYVPKDNMSEYNVFVRKLIPTAQLINLLVSPTLYWTNF